MCMLLGPDRKTGNEMVWSEGWSDPTNWTGRLVLFMALCKVKVTNICNSQTKSQVTSMLTRLCRCLVSA
jgi:hypothetical protein